MTLFTNSNFIHHIVRSQGVDNSIPHEQYPLLQTLVELQTRLLIEKALKFMRRDRRDQLSLEDLELALKDLNHSDLLISPSGHYRIQEEFIVKEDKVFTSPAAVMEEQLALMGSRQLEAPRLSGRWVFLRGKVPATSENVNIKKLEQLKESGKHEYEQKRKLCNIIKDDPYSFLNAQQSQYFISICKTIKNDSAPTGFKVEGDLIHLMPFFLKFLAEVDINQTAMAFMIKLLENKYIWKSIEFFAVKIFHILMAYKGPQSFEVGVWIAQMVDHLCEKYPNVRDIYVGYDDQSFSTILKKIPFQLCIGIPFEIDQTLLEKMRKDADKNDPLAILCLKKLLQHSGQLRVFGKLLAQEMNTFIYWQPSPELKGDPFLRMF